MMLVMTWLTGGRQSPNPRGYQTTMEEESIEPRGGEEQ